MVVSRSDRKLGGKMTVGIGTICQSGQCVLMAADMRGSFEDASLPPHEYLGKQYPLPNGFNVNTAGAKVICQSMASELYTQIEKVANEPNVYHDHIRNAIRETQFLEFAYRVDHELRFRLATTLEEWKAMATTTLLYRRAQRMMHHYYLNVQLSVGGFLSDGHPLLLTMHGNEPPEMDDLSVIGSGTDPALEVLSLRGQNPHTGIVRSIMHVHDAMEAAKLKDKYVGRCEAMVVLTPKQIRILQLHSDFIKELVGSFAGRDTEPLDNDGKRFNALMAELHHPGITKAEYDAGKRKLTHSDKPIGERFS
jgi:hypothetical protein